MVASVIRKYLQFYAQKSSYNMPKVPKSHMNWLILNSWPTGKFFMLLLSAEIFFKINFLKISFSNMIRVSKSLDPDQA